MPHDKIILRRLSFFAHHGVLEQEAHLGQRFTVSLEAKVNLKRAGKTDEVNDSVCYNQMAQLCLKIGTTQRFKTLEALAETIVEKLFHHFPPLEQITLFLEKPSAAIPCIFESVGIEITRERGNLLH